LSSKGENHEGCVPPSIKFDRLVNAPFVVRLLQLMGGQTACGADEFLSFLACRSSFPIAH